MVCSIVVCGVREGGGSALGLERNGINRFIPRHLQHARPGVVFQGPRPRAPAAGAAPLRRTLIVSCGLARGCVIVDDGCACWAISGSVASKRANTAKSVTRFMRVPFFMDRNDDGILIVLYDNAVHG